MKYTLATIGVIVVGIAGALLLLTGFQQAANAQTFPSNANPVGQVVSGNNPNIMGNQEHMQTCKQFSSAQSCATNPIFGNGPFTSNLAHQTNKP